MLPRHLVHLEHRGSILDVTKFVDLRQGGFVQRTRVSQ